MINCLVVDDEPIARAGILEHMQQVSYLNPVATCRSAVEALPFLNSGEIDAIFLDVQMPQLTGIDLIRALVHPPLVVLTTAYPEYALESYELDVADYLLKPITFTRFLKAAEKLQRLMKEAEKLPPATNDYFFIKSNGRIEKISLSDLIYVEASSNYVVLHTRSGRFVSYLTFNGVASQLPPPRFVRIHKSFLVAFDAIESIDSSSLTLAGVSLPISKPYRNTVMTMVEQRLLHR